MTKNASRLISPLLLTALTGHVVRIDSFEEEPSDKIDHIDLAKTIELLVIAPATANMLGKLSSGIADDFLSTLFLAVECPVLIAPAMNEAMYLNKQTQENIKDSNPMVFDSLAQKKDIWHARMRVGGGSPLQTGSLPRGCICWTRVFP